MFDHCVSLYQITIPEGITSLSQFCFSSSGLLSIVLPSSLNKIEEAALFYAPLKEVIGDNNDLIDVDYEIVRKPSSGKTDIWIEQENFVFYKKGDSIELIKFIGNQKSVTLPTLSDNKTYCIDNRCFLGELLYYYSYSFPGEVVKYTFDLSPLSNEMTEITISRSVDTICVGPFFFCKNIKVINFDGTKAEWNAIKKVEGWNQYISATIIHCKDGNVTI